MTDQVGAHGSATGLGSAEAPMPPSRHGPSGAIPCARDTPVFSDTPEQVGLTHGRLCELMDRAWLALDFVDRHLDESLLPERHRCEIAIATQALFNVYQMLGALTGSDSDNGGKVAL